MSTSTRNHVTFHTPWQSDLSRHSPKKKILFLSENSFNNSSKGRKRRSVITINTETDVCSTKASINKKISDFFNKVKKKLVSIFMIFTPNNDADENELMVELEKKLEKLKQMLNKITKKLPEKKRKNVYNK